MTVYTHEGEDIELRLPAWVSERLQKLLAKTRWSRKRKVVGDASELRIVTDLVLVHV